MPRTLPNFGLHHPHQLFQQQLQAFHQQFKVFHQQQHINQSSYYDPMASLYAQCASPTRAIPQIPYQNSSSLSTSSSPSSPPSMVPDVRRQSTGFDPFRASDLRIRDDIIDKHSGILPPSLGTPFDRIKPTLATSDGAGALIKAKSNTTSTVSNGPSSQSLKTITKRPSRAHKSKRVRTIFTPEQLKRLEQEFSNQMYLVGHDREYLAKSLNLTESQVKVWFQNRRIKFRKVNPGPGLNDVNFNEFTEETDNTEATTSDA